VPEADTLPFAAPAFAAVPAFAAPAFAAPALPAVSASASISLSADWAAPVDVVLPCASAAKLLRWSSRIVSPWAAPPAAPDEADSELAAVPALVTVAAVPPLAAALEPDTSCIGSVDAWKSCAWVGKPLRGFSLIPSSRIVSSAVPDEVDREFAAVAVYAAVLAAGAVLVAVAVLTAGAVLTAVAVFAAVAVLAAGAGAFSVVDAAVLFCASAAKLLR